ncbi:MAG TPA: hypothetical protein VMT52_00490 [Planctomycetota bacterium]|nr:hypothetical protein [Planctomycetota bacterium]
MPRVFAGGTPLGQRLQLAAAWGFGVPTGLLALGAILLAAGALSREVESRRIELVVTKPVGAWKLLLGSLLGILAAVTAVLALVLGAFVLNVTLIARAVSSSDGERDEARDRFFTPRVAIPPVRMPLDEEAVERRVEAALADPHEDRSRREVEARVRRSLERRKAAPGESTELTFRGVPRAPGGNLLLRYEVQSAAIDMAVVEWEAGSGLVASGSRVYRTGAQSSVPGSPRVVALPADVVPADGTLRLVLTNRAPADSGPTLVVEPSRIQLLVPHGSFWANVLRVVLAALAEVALLIAVGLLGSSVFSFPTAALLALFVQVTALVSGFLRDALLFHASSGEDGSLLAHAGRKASAAAAVILEALSAFGSLEPMERLGEGRALPAGELAAALVRGVGAGALILLLGAWLLSRRELGKVDGA